MEPARTRIEDMKCWRTPRLRYGCLQPRRSRHQGERVGAPPARRSGRKARLAAGRRPGPGHAGHLERNAAAWPRPCPRRPRAGHPAFGRESRSGLPHGAPGSRPGTAALPDGRGADLRGRTRHHARGVRMAVARQARPSACHGHRRCRTRAADKARTRSRDHGPSAGDHPDPAFEEAALGGMARPPGMQGMSAGPGSWP